MKRRDFLKNTSKAVVIPSIAGKLGAKAYAMSPFASLLGNAVDTDHVLVIIFMSGGNDGLNTVVPLDQMSQLSQARPHVILPESSLLQLPGTQVGLHPALQGFKNLYDEDRLQIIQNVGYPNPDFSHFRSTDIWMSGANSDEILNSGWTGRYLNYEYANYPNDYPNAVMPDPLAIEIGWSSSLLFQGPTHNMGMLIQDPTDFYNLVDNVEEPAPDTFAGDRLKHIRLMAKQSQLYGTVIKSAAESVNNQLDYPQGNSLAEKLKIVARLIKGGLKTRVYMVEHGGFDTHDYQVDPNDHTQGEHAYLLMQLSEAVSSFMGDCDHLGISERVMGMTMSEFGRRVISNASGGTDHGEAAPLFLFGNHVNSGLVGINPDIPWNANYASNVSMEFDFRSIYGSLFEQWLCVDPADTSNILLHDFERLDLVDGDQCDTATSTHEVNAAAGKSFLNVYPTMINSNTTVEFQGGQDRVSIKVIDMSGKTVETIYNGIASDGVQKIQWDASGLLAGNYIVSFQSRNVVQSKQVVKGF